MGPAKKLSLSPKPRRTDFTDREFCNIIGGLLGGLIHAGEIDDLRNAVRWWAETDEAWKSLEITKAMGQLGAVAPEGVNGLSPIKGAN